MAYTDSVLVLSTSTNGAPVLVASSSTPGTTIHTSSSTSGVKDFLTLAASNTDTVIRYLVLNWAGVDWQKIWLPPQQGAVYICRSQPIWGGGLVRAWSDSSSTIYLTAMDGTVRTTDS